ncbi:MAG: ABC transporter permease subunit [Aggregatilineales bacterium]
MTDLWTERDEPQPELQADRPINLPSITTTFLLPKTRPGRIFWRALRDNAMGIVIWGSVFSLLLAALALIFPYQQESNTLVNILSGLGLLERLTGAREIDIAAFSTFEGYLALQVLGWAPIIFSAYLIPQAINAVMAEERDGTLDLLLTTPLPRWRFLTEKALAIVVSLMCILFMMMVTLIIVTQAIAEIDFAIWQPMNSMWHIFPISMIILAFTLFLCVTLRQPRTAGGLAALFVLGNYFIRAISDMTDLPIFNILRHINLFEYYASVAALTEGVNLARDLGVVAFAGLIFLLAVVQFQRRDIGV